MSSRAGVFPYSQNNKEGVTMAEYEKTPRKPFLLSVVPAVKQPQARPFGGEPPEETEDADAGSDSKQSVTDLHIEPFQLVPHRRGVFEFPRISIRREK